MEVQEGTLVCGSRAHGRRCGADVSELIEAQPRDGEVHVARCPRCKFLHHWWSTVEGKAAPAPDATEVAIAAFLAAEAQG